MTPREEERAAACPYCGQRMPRPMTDDQIVAALEYQSGGMLYASNDGHGGADYSQWYLTRGAGGPFTHAQVKRIVAAGRLVPYADHLDSAYTTPEARKRLDDKVSRRRATRLNQDAGR